MINAWIVVRQEIHLEDKYWVCLECEDALRIAADVTAYWKDKYKPDPAYIDEICYDDLVFNFHDGDAFRIFVEPCQIREAGEFSRETK